MSTVLRIDGWRVLIYPNDHLPAHVHVRGPGWIVVIDLITPEVREVIGCSEREAYQVLRQVAEHGSMLMDEWRRFHG